MIQSFILKKPEDINEIDELDDEFYVIITTPDAGWIRYYIRHENFAYSVYDNCNNFIDSYLSIVEAVKKCYNQINYEIYG